MTRELFVEIITKQMWIPLLCIILGYLVSWFLGLRLGLLVMSVRFDFRKLSLVCILGSLFSFWAKQLLPMPLVGLLLPLFTAILLWLVVRGLHPLKYGWGSLIILVTSLISNTIFQAPLCAAEPRIAHFLLKTAWGFVVGTGLESMGSVLAIILLPQMMPKLKTPLIPRIGSRTDRVDLSALLVCLGLSFLVYLAAIILYIGLINGSRLVLLFLLFQLSSMAFMIIGHFQTLKSMQKKFEMEKFDLVAEKEKLAIEKAELAADKVDLQARVNQLEEETQTLNEQLKAKTIDPEEAARGLIGVTQRVLQSLNDTRKQPKLYNFSVRQGGSVRFHLTPRESEALLLVAAGKSDKEIAQELDIETSWARNIVKSILAKTKFVNRTQLAVFAVLNGLVDPDQVNIQPQPNLQHSKDLEDET